MKYQDALQHLACIDLIELCNEAKVEHCRATRDLRSCGRPVECMLNSCGHASLCGECAQRCDTCPICRIPLPKGSNRIRLRLYYECVEAGLIPKSCENKFHEKEDDEAHLTADVQRLYSLFDVAMENNLSCLICHYVTDVCMDESAVSSDPVIAFLLDEVVVKDWCKRTFRNIVTELCDIYTLEADEMKSKMNSFIKFTVKLAGLSNVLEVLELSFKGTHSAKLDDLHHLQEDILKTKQHMEMMMWCIRHKFLENVRSRFSDHSSWRILVRQRKSAAIQRAWPELVDNSMESTGQSSSTLFIEDALLNLEMENGYDQGGMVESEIASLQRDGGLSFFRSKLEGLVGFYPFEDLRAAVDILFLYGSSDMIIAKQAIFLYYLFDRHWTLPKEDWRQFLDDFAATFSTARHSLLESLTFYLLDDHTEEALEEACQLLPEIAGPESHPKIAKVLLERQNPDAALMFLRWCGHDSRAELLSLAEAVTAVRVRVECGLLTEAFMYQRSLCTKVKGKKVKHQLPVDSSDNVKDESRTSMNWVDVLVTEICCLCIRRNLVDRMIELPWNSDEESYLHKCLLEYAIDSPSTTVGTLLIVFNLQRYRYVDAYHVHRRLQVVEREFISKNNVSQEILQRMKSAAQWRGGLVDKCVQLLPEVQQQQLKSGKLSEGTVWQFNNINIAREADVLETQAGAATILSMSSSPEPSLQMDDKNSSFRPSGFGSSKLAGSWSNSHFEIGKFASPLSTSGTLSTNAERGLKGQFGIVKNFKVGNILTPAVHENNSRRLSKAKEINRTSVLQGDLQDLQGDEFSPEVDQNGLYERFPEISPPYSRRIMAKPFSTPSSNSALLNGSPQERFTTASSKRRLAAEVDKTWAGVSSVDEMDISWSHEESASGAENFYSNAVPRWRSDEASEEEEEQRQDRTRGITSSRTPIRGSRRSRLSRR
ncbi:hypothetical protein Ancab_030112 [Ancistrocladus abbreviatus]